MDSVSQLVLGASCAAVVAPAAHRRAALLIGAAIGTLPDLDVLINFGGAVQNFTMHRGFSHSLLVLPLVAGVLFLALWRFWPAAREAPRRWAGAVFLALLTHPLLDAFTVYGTQLFWPSEATPVAAGSVFIIDPLYTLPLLFASVLAWWWRAAPRAQRALVLGLTISSSYLLWSLGAQAWVREKVWPTVQAEHGADARLLVVATPLNTLLWRVLVVRADGDYAEGFVSLLRPKRPLELSTHKGNADLAHGLDDQAVIQRLNWFTRGLFAFEEVGGALIIKDLRMGAEESYVFKFVIARRDGTGVLRAVEPELLPWPARGAELAARVWALALNPNAGVKPQNQSRQ